jgi:gliding motility-associated-like protein
MLLHFRPYLYLHAILCMSISSFTLQSKAQCARIGNAQIVPDQSEFCASTATVFFASQVELNTDSVLIQTSTAPANWQAPFSFQFNTQSNGCLYFLHFDGSLTMWGNTNHLDAFSKFSITSNAMYANSVGFDQFLSPQADIEPFAYNPQHAYNYYYAGDGTSAFFAFSDFPYWDNYGQVTFDWYAIPHFSYLWDFGDGSTSDQANLVHQFTATGEYTVTLTITDLLDNCSVTVQTTIVLHESPVVEANGLEDHYCITDPSSTLNSNPAGGLFTGIGIEDNIFHPPLAGAGGPYIILCHYLDEYGCADSTFLTTTVFSLPEVALEGLQDSYCEDDDPALLSGIPSGGVLAGDGVSGTYFHPDLWPNNLEAQLTYSFTDGQGCTAQSSKSTIVRPLPSLDLGVDTAVCFPIQLELDPGYFEFYLWQDHSTLRSYHTTSPGIFSITVWNQFGCNDSDTIRIMDACTMTFYVPNAFTPDHDGINDVFQPVFGNSLIEQYELTIFDRWGKIVFQSTNPDNFWDGGHGSTYVQADVYVWQISCIGKGASGPVYFHERGFVNVVR